MTRDAWSFALKITWVTRFGVAHVLSPLWGLGGFCSSSFPTARAMGYDLSPASRATVPNLEFSSSSGVRRAPLQEENRAAETSMTEPFRRAGGRSRVRRAPLETDLVRAGLVSRPEDWRWSGYNEYAGVSGDEQKERCGLVVDRVRMPSDPQARI